MLALRMPRSDARTAMALVKAGDSPAMAKGYPVLPETQVLPECLACGSRRFRDERGRLRCEDCGVRQRDPFGI
jgi:hypothetical protein